MLRIVLVTALPESVRSFAEALLLEPEVHLDYAGSGAEALTIARTASPHLVVLDSELPDAEPLKLISELLTLNAMVNTAVISPLPEEEFHEASEGLGVLARLPLNPGGDDAAELVRKLRRVL